MSFDPSSAVEDDGDGFGFDPSSAVEDDSSRMPLPSGVQASSAGGGRGGQGGPTADELRLHAARRGTSRGTSPYVAPDPSERARPLERPDDVAPPEPQGLTEREMREGSIAPWRLEQMKQEDAYYRGLRTAGSARPLTKAQELAQDAAGLSDNPVYRGALAGFSQLGKTGVGAARLVADIAGADELAKFAGDTSKTASDFSAQSQRGLSGNAKLVADVTASIVGTAPALAVGTIGGPALTTIFAQSALGEYNEGRDAGFGVTESAARAGIMGTAEALGERFGFSEQISILKGMARGKSASELSHLAAEMIAKEIPGEQLTTVTQFLADKLGPAALKPNATLSDLLGEMGQTFAVTVGQSLALGGAPVALRGAREVHGRVDIADPNALIASAIDDSVQRTHFKQDAIDGYAARASDPKFYDPTFVDPRSTVAPMPEVRAEDMPTRPFTPDEVSTLRQAAQTGVHAPAPAFDPSSAVEDTKRAQPQEPAQEIAPTQEPPARVSSFSDGASLGVARVPQGSIADKAEAELRTNAQDASTAEVAQPAAPSPTPAVSSTTYGSTQQQHDGAAVAGTPRASAGVSPAGTEGAGRLGEPAPRAGGPVAGPAADQGRGAGTAGAAGSSPAAPRVAEPQQREAALRSLNVAAQGEALVARERSKITGEHAPAEVPQLADVTHENSLDAGQLELAHALTTAYGRPLMVTRAAKGESPYDGAFVNGVVAIDEGTREAPIAVVVHEGIHALDDDLKRDVIAAVTPTLKNHARFIKTFGYADDAHLNEEMVAVLAQEQAKTATFWKELRGKVGDKGFGKLAGAIISSIDKLLSGFRNANESKRWTTNVRAVRAAITDAMAEQIKRTKQRAADGQTKVTDQQVEEPMHSRRARGASGREVSNPDEIDDIGGFNIDRMMSEDAGKGDGKKVPKADAKEVDMSPEDWAALQKEADKEASRKPEKIVADEAFGDMPHIPDDAEGHGDAIDLRELAAELEAEGFGVSGVRRGTQAEPGEVPDFSKVSDDEIKAQGIMAEDAYPELARGPEQTDETNGDVFYELSAKVGGKVWTADTVKHDGYYAAITESDSLRKTRPHSFGSPLSFRGSLEGGDKWHRRVMASADLHGRKFDLYEAIPQASRTRVAATWKKIAKIPKAFRYGEAVSIKGATSFVDAVQRLADSMTRDSGVIVTAETSPRDDGSGRSIRLNITMPGRPAATYGDMEYNTQRPAARGGPFYEMHTVAMDAGSKAGGVFYQIALTFADMADKGVEADPIGLTGINTYRRTEQMLSTALRTGRAKGSRPGIGQRVYGWEPQAKTADQEERNLARLALAGARNATEFFPVVRDWRYDLAADKFTRKDGTEVPELDIDLMLAQQDARAAGLSRSTLARAALTWQAIDGKVNLDGITELKTPVLYSRRRPKEDEPLAERLSGRRVAIPVRVAETGETATMTVDGGAYVRQLDQRREVLKKLARCLA